MLAMNRAEMRFHQQLLSQGLHMIASAVDIPCMVKSLLEDECNTVSA